MVHLFPYWDFNEGQLIDVRVCSNAPLVELFMNGRSQGTFEINHAHGSEKELSGHSVMDAIYYPGINEYNGNRSIQIVIKNYKLR